MNNKGFFNRIKVRLGDMKYILQLALKNVLRAKRRAVLTFMMLIFGVTIYIILSSMFAGFDKSSFDNVINFETGHLKIRNAKYDKERPFDLDYLLEDPQKVMDTLGKKQYVKGFTRRIIFFSEIDNMVDSTPVLGVGIDLKNDQKVFNLKEFIREGELTEDGAVIGVPLAKEMGLSLGDEFYLTFRNKHGMYTSITTWVSGLLYSPDPASNNSKVYVSLDFVLPLLGTQNPGEITVITDDVDKAPDYETELRKELPGVKVESWKTISYAFAAITQTKKSASGMIIFMILIIAMIGIVNTILISVYEKRREIGTLKAMGMKDSEVRNLFIAEGFFIGLSGSIIGCVFGALANIPFVYHGIDFGAMLEEMDMGVQMISIIKSVWVPSNFVTAILLSTVASIFASYLPARKVMKMQPVECLRTVQ